MSGQAPRATTRQAFCALQSERGLTTVELLITTLVVGLIMGSMYSLLFGSQVVFENQLDEQALRQGVRLGLRDLTIKLRNAGFNIKNVPEIFTDARATTLSFASDIDNGSEELPCTNESSSTSGVELLTYRINAGNLERRVRCWTGAAWSDDNGIDWQVIAIDVAAGTSVFRYFDASNVEMSPGLGSLSAAQRSQIAAVMISLQLEDTTAETVFGRDDHPTSGLTSLIRVRNSLP